jgi:hypothetical protein
MENLLVDQKFVHTVRREIEANAVKIYTALVAPLITSKNLHNASIDEQKKITKECIEFSIGSAIALRKGIDKAVVGKNVPVRDSNDPTIPQWRPPVLSSGYKVDDKGKITKIDNVAPQGDLTRVLTKQNFKMGSDDDQ